MLIYIGCFFLVKMWITLTLNYCTYINLSVNNNDVKWFVSGKMLSADVEEFVPQALRTARAQAALEVTNAEVASAQEVKKDDVFKETEGSATNELLASSVINVSTSADSNIESATDSTEAAAAASDGACIHEESTLITTVQNDYPDSTLSATSAEFIPSVDYNSAMFVGFNSPTDSPGPHVPYVNGSPGHSAASYMYTNKPPMYYGQQSAHSYGYYPQAPWATDVDYATGYSQYNAMPFNASTGASHYSGGNYYVPDGYLFDSSEYHSNAGLMMDSSYFSGCSFVDNNEFAGGGLHPMQGGRGGGNIRRGNKSRRRPSDHGGGGRGGAVGGGRVPSTEMRINGQTGELTVGKKRVQSSSQSTHETPQQVTVQASAIINNAENWPTLNIGKPDKLPNVTNVAKPENLPVLPIETQVNTTTVSPGIGNSTLSFSSMTKKNNEVKPDFTAINQQEPELGKATVNGQKSRKKTKSVISEGGNSIENTSVKSQKISTSVSQQEKNEPEFKSLPVDAPVGTTTSNKTESCTSSQTRKVSETSSSLINGNSSDETPASNVDRAGTMSKSAKKKARKRMNKNAANANPSDLKDDSEFLNCKPFKMEDSVKPVEKLMYAEATCKPKKLQAGIPVEKIEKELPLNNSKVATGVTVKTVKRLSLSNTSDKQFPKPAANKQTTLANNKMHSVLAGSVIDKKNLSSPQTTPAAPNVDIPPTSTSPNTTGAQSPSEESEWTTVVKKSKAKRNSFQKEMNEYSQQRNSQQQERNEKTSFQPDSRGRKFRSFDGEDPKNFNADARNGQKFHDHDGDDSGKKFRSNVKSVMNGDGKIQESIGERNGFKNDSKKNCDQDDKENITNGNCRPRNFRDTLLAGTSDAANGKKHKFRDPNVEANFSDVNSSCRKFRDPKVETNFSDVNSSCRKFYTPEIESNSTATNNNLSTMKNLSIKILKRYETFDSENLWHIKKKEETIAGLSHEEGKKNEVINASLITSNKKDPNDPEMQEILKKRAIRKENIAREKKLNREAAALQKAAHARKDTKISLVSIEKRSIKENSPPYEVFKMNTEEYPSLGVKKLPKATSDQMMIPQKPECLPVKPPKANYSKKGGNAIIPNPLFVKRTALQTIPSASADSSSGPKTFSYSAAAATPLPGKSLNSASDSNAIAELTVSSSGKASSAGPSNSQPSQQPRKSKHVKSTDAMTLNISALIKVR